MPLLLPFENGQFIFTDETTDDAEATYSKMKFIEKETPFMIGDFINYCIAKFGEDAAYNILDEREADTDMRYARVCERFSPRIRIRDLSFSHHRAVMGLDDGDAFQVLNHAKDEGWSVADTKDAVRQIKMLPCPSETQFDEPAPHIETPDEVRDKVVHTETGASTSALFKQANRPFGELVRLIDKMATAIGSKGPNHSGADLALSDLHRYMTNMGDGNP